MADMTEVYNALRNADAAGDVEGARKLADYIRSSQQSQPEQDMKQGDQGGIRGLNRSIGQAIFNAGSGAVRGAGSIGATILYPWDKAQDLYYGDRDKNISGLITGNNPTSRNEERRLAIDAGLREMGAETDSYMYAGGKLAGEIAGTAGAGGALAKGLTMVPRLAQAAPGLANALRTGGMTAGGAGMGTRVAGGALTGGAMSGMVNPEDIGTGALIGGALPVAVKGAGLIGSKIAKAMHVSPEISSLAQKAKTLGIDIPADRIANSKILNAGAASLDYVPFSGRIATETKMNDQIKRALSNTFGENTDTLSKDLFAKTQVKLGKGFDDFLTQNKLKVDQQLFDDLKTSLTKAKNELSDDNYRIIENQVKDLWGKIDNGIIDGNAAYNVKKTLDRLSKGSGNEAWHAKQIRSAMMDALKRSVGTDKAQEFTELQRKYANLKSLEKLAGNSAEGDISMARLGNIDSRNQEVSDLSKIAATFAKGRESPHGAMQRVSIGSGVAALGGGALAGFAAPIAAGMTAGRGANMALNSNALRNLLVGQPTTGNKLSELLANPATRAALIASQSR